MLRLHGRWLPWGWSWQVWKETSAATYAKQEDGFSILPVYFIFLLWNQFPSYTGVWDTAIHQSRRGCQASRKPQGEHMASEVSEMYLNTDGVEEALDTHCSFHHAIPAGRQGLHSLERTLFPGLQLNFWRG